MGTMNAVDWKRLPENILEKVWDKLELQEDVVRAGATCRSWHAVFTNYRLFHRNWNTKAPMLLVSDNQRRHGMYASYNVTRNRTKNLAVKIAYNRRFCGSSNGWLAAMNKDYSMTLYKAYSKDALTVSLPPVLPPFRKDLHQPYGPNVTDLSDPILKDPFLRRYANGKPKSLELPLNEEEEILVCDNHEKYLETVLITSDPILDPSRCVVVAMFRNMCDLAITRPGKDNTWTRIVPHTNNMRCRLRDLIYHGDKLYMVNHCGSVLSLSLSDPTTLELVAPATPIQCFSKGNLSRYIVISELGELFQVLRSEDIKFDTRTLAFVVYIWHPDRAKWRKTKNLNGMSFFLGISTSICVPASLNTRPDRIFFTPSFDMYLYNKKNKKIRDVGVAHLPSGNLYYYQDKYSQYSHCMNDQPPIWILPTINP